MAHPANSIKMLMISENAYVNTAQAAAWNVQSTHINAKICTVFIYFLLLFWLFFCCIVFIAVVFDMAWHGVVWMSSYSFYSSYLSMFVFIRYFKWILLFVVKCWWCAKYLMLMSMVHEMCIDISAPFAFYNNIIKTWIESSSSSSSVSSSSSSLSCTKTKRIKCKKHDDATEKRWVFYSPSPGCCIVYMVVAGISGVYIAKRQTIASSGNHCHQLVLFRAFYQVLYDLRILLRCCCRSRCHRRRFYGTTALSLMQQPFDLRKLIKIINNEKWQWRRRTTHQHQHQHQKQQTTELFSFYIIPRENSFNRIEHAVQTHTKSTTPEFVRSFLSFLCGTICTDLVHHVIYGMLKCCCCCCLFSFFIIIWSDV